MRPTVYTSPAVTTACNVRRFDRMKWWGVWQRYIVCQVIVPGMRFPSGSLEPMTDASNFIPGCGVPYGRRGDCTILVGPTAGRFFRGCGIQLKDKMREYYKIAENIFSVTIPEELTTWHELRPRYAPFAVEPDAETMLDVVVTNGSMPEFASAEVYEPDHAGVGFITSRMLRLGDGATVVEFMDVEDSSIRLQMQMPYTFERCELYFQPRGDDKDAYFLPHALMVAYMAAAIERDTLMMHSSVVVHGGFAYIFQGKSGTGKSTHSRMWLQHIEGAELLNDDNPLVRFAADGTAMVYGSPWSGKTHCYRNAGAPVGAFVRIVRGEENRLVALPPLRGYASLTASVMSAPFFDEQHRNRRHRVIERLVTSVRCCEMHCRPDADAARVCRDSLSD